MANPETLDRRAIAELGGKLIAGLPADVVLQRRGEVVAVDVVSGDYEIDPDEVQVGLRLLGRRPGAVAFLGRVGGEPLLRVGYSAPVGARR